MHFTMSENALAQQVFHSTLSEVYSPMQASQGNFTPLQVVGLYLQDIPQSRIADCHKDMTP